MGDSVFVDIVDVERVVNPYGGKNRPKESIKWLVTLSCGHKKQVTRRPTAGYLRCPNGCTIDRPGYGK